MVKDASIYKKQFTGVWNRAAVQKEVKVMFCV